MDTLTELFEDELKDIYSAENQILKALPRMAKKASSTTLKQAFTSHLEQTRGHVQRLEKVGEELGIKLKGKTCQAMKGLVEEGKEILDEKSTGPVIDAALIGACQRIEHYEMAAYGTVRAIAEQLEHTNVAALLQETLNEEKVADEKLTKIATKEVLAAAYETEEEETEEEDEE